MRDVIEIRTDRLRLRELRVSDGARVAHYAGDPAVARMIARAPIPYLEAAAEGWIMIVRARAPKGEDFVYAIEREGEGLIGVVGAHRKNDDAFDVGYWIGRPFWGQGYATEALHGFLSEARGLGALEAGHFIDNPASGRVLEKAGFAYTGETAPLFSLARGQSALCKRMRYEPKARVLEPAADAAAA